MDSFKLKSAVLCGFSVVVFLLLPPPRLSFAQSTNPSEVFWPNARIEQLQGVPFKNDFSIGPTKLSFTVKPGETVETVLQITSRLTDETKFEVGIEDFTSQEDPAMYTKFLGNEKSQFSSKEWITPASLGFSLKHGERIYLPIKITVPFDAEPGDHYSAVFVKTVPSSGGAAFTLSSRIGSLFLFSVAGNIKTEGSLNSFRAFKNLFLSIPVGFELNFGNSGNVHLTPSGKIIVSNFFGKVVSEVPVNEWVVLRGSKRIQTVSWEPKFAFGIYTAKAEIGRGYDEIMDTKTVLFYVFPLKFVGLLVLGLILLVSLFKLLTSRVDIKLKKKNSKK